MTSTCRRSCATDALRSHRARSRVLRPHRDVPGAPRDHHPRRRGLQTAVRDLQSRATTSATTLPAVAANRRRLATAVGLDDGIVWMNQVHSANVAVVDGAGETVDNTDGLVTTTPRLALAVVTADCVPVLMADARAGVIAAVHAGRVGAQRASSRARCRPWWTPAPASRTSRCCSGPPSADATTRCPRRWPPRSSGSLPGSRTTTHRGTPGSGPAGRDRRDNCAPWASPRSTSIHGARSRTATCSAIVVTAPTGRLASLVWLEPGS